MGSKKGDVLLVVDFECEKYFFEAFCLIMNAFWTKAVRKDSQFSADTLMFWRLCSGFKFTSVLQNLP